MPILENQQIHLRALEPEDLEALYCWENDASLWSLGSTLAPYSRYILKEYIAFSGSDIFEARQLRLMIECKRNNLPVGTIDLYGFEPHHHRAGIGILIDPRYQKRGLATQALELLTGYAFKMLKCHQLYVHVPVGNTASQKLFNRCGFKVTGTLVEWIVTQEGYTDVIVMQKINRL
ncbi:MAG: GNAT family N-acetyltransferase [Tannerellaceae bacterium]|nr:GNAT family N-acetyltransferase [Tannerellaceae bacterium]MCD8264135.1 GNAT family N-acetyltransferase [Tannerellaceae bacterium]